MCVVRSLFTTQFTTLTLKCEASLWYVKHTQAFADTKGGQADVLDAATARELTRETRSRSSGDRSVSRRSHTIRYMYPVYDDI